MTNNYQLELFSEDKGPDYHTIEATDFESALKDAGFLCLQNNTELISIEKLITPTPDVEHILHFIDSGNAIVDESDDGELFIEFSDGSSANPECIYDAQEKIAHELSRGNIPKEIKDEMGNYNWHISVKLTLNG